jgi:hypothetical protein
MARANVRIAPRRWRQRPIVDAEDGRLARLHLLADAALGIVRAATGALDDHQAVPPAPAHHIAALAAAIDQLTSVPQPWPPDLLRAVAEAAGQAIEHGSAARADWATVIASTISATALDLQAVIERPRAPEPGNTPDVIGVAVQTPPGTSAKV